MKQHQERRVNHCRIRISGHASFFSDVSRERRCACRRRLGRLCTALQAGAFWLRNPGVTTPRFAETGLRYPLRPPLPHTARRCRHQITGTDQLSAYSDLLDGQGAEHRSEPCSRLCRLGKGGAWLADWCRAFCTNLLRLRGFVIQHEPESHEHPHAMASKDALRCHVTTRRRVRRSRQSPSESKRNQLSATGSTFIRTSLSFRPPDSLWTLSRDNQTTWRRGPRRVSTSTRENWYRPASKVIPGNDYFPHRFLDSERQREPRLSRDNYILARSLLVEKYWLSAKSVISHRDGATRHSISNPSSVVSVEICIQFFVFPTQAQRNSVYLSGRLVT